MIMISIAFTDQQAKEIDYFLRKKYKKDKRTNLSKLCKIAVFHEIQIQAKKDIKEAEKEYGNE